MLSRKTMYICSGDGDDLIYTKIKRRLSIILLKEDIFIKIIKVNKKNKLEKLLKENISSTFRYYDILTHYEIVRFNGENYLIIYFIKYYNYLKEIIDKGKIIDIKPYEFTKGFKRKGNGLNIVVKAFRKNIYLVASVKNTVVYTKHFNEYEDINCYVAECLEYLRGIFSVEGFILFVQESLYNRELSKLTNNIKMIKGKVS